VNNARRVLLLIIILAVATLTAVGSVMKILFDAAMEGQRVRLVIMSGQMTVRVSVTAAIPGPASKEDQIDQLSGTAKRRNTAQNQGNPHLSA